MNSVDFFFFQAETTFIGMASFEEKEKRQYRETNSANRGGGSQASLPHAVQKGGDLVPPSCHSFLETKICSSFSSPF